jgi:hypothetical protein
MVSYLIASTKKIRGGGRRRRSWGHLLMRNVLLPFQWVFIKGDNVY